MAPDSLVAWLERLQAARLIELSPRVIQECARVLALREAWRREDLADSLASLLAQDESAWRAIRAHFLEYAGVVLEGPVVRRNDAVSTRVSSGNERRARFLQKGWTSRLSGMRWAVVLFVVVVMGFAVVLGLLTRLRDPFVSETSVVDPKLTEMHKTSARNQAALAEPMQAAPGVTVLQPTAAYRIELEEPATRTTIEEMATPPVDREVRFGPPWLRWIFLGLPPLLALVAARWWQAVGEYGADIRAAAMRAAEARREAHAAGTAFGVPYHIEQVPPFDFSWADDAATILGRLSRGDVGDELDVSPTIGRTIAAGGQITAAFVREGRREVLVVLVDTETGGHPYLDGVEQILARWRRTGLVVDRYDYGRVPTRLRRWPDGRPIDLERLARRSEGRPFLMFSRMAGARDYSGDVSWLRVLGAWPVRAWIDLDPRTPAERPEMTLLATIAASGLRRFPWTGEDLVLCARYIAAHGEGIRERLETPLPAADPEILWKWAACAALVPDPSWPQLDAVRRALPELRAGLPDQCLVQRLIEWARQEGLGEEGRDHLLGEGDRLAFDPDKRTALIARLRRWDEERFPLRTDRIEFRARALLLHQLEAADTRGDVLGEHLRRLKQAFHRAAMHPDEAERLLTEFADSAGARELQSLVVEELTLQAQGRALAGAWAPGTRDALSAWSTGAARARLIDLMRLGSWRWQGVVRALPWAVVGVLSGLAWMWVESDAVMEPIVVHEVETPRSWRVVSSEMEAPSAGGVLSRQCDQPGLTALADTAPLCFVALASGEFMMGSHPDTDRGARLDENQHRAQVAAFAVGTHEVTLGQWRAVMGAVPPRCQGPCTDDLPAHNVSWNDACEFLVKLTERENMGRRTRGEPQLSPCYTQIGDTWEWTDRACTGFRLPTETEWEYAARAGSSSEYYFGADPEKLCLYANGPDAAAKRDFIDNEYVDCDDGFARLAPVGRFLPNKWGLHDVVGNVFEWVWDWYGLEYPREASELGYSGGKAGELRVLRGGSYRLRPRWLRSAIRFGDLPGIRTEIAGFRCVRSL